MERRDLASIVECAGLAPSVHNTQPWTFLTSPDEIVVRAERRRGPRRSRPVRPTTVDQLWGGRGVLPEQLFHALGHECAITILPDDNDSDLIARLSFGERRPETEQDAAMVASITRRFTDRGSYTPVDLAPGLILELDHGIDARGGWLKVINDPADRVAVIQALTAAEDAEATDPAYRTELDTWVRAAKGVDGIPVAALDAGGSTNSVNEVPLRDFTGHNQHPHPGGDGPPPTVERDTLIAIGTSSDTPRDWVNAGQAVGWLLLRLTLANISTQPLGQALDIESVRQRLAGELGLLGHIQFLVRTGLGHGSPTTGRREPLIHAV